MKIVPIGLRAANDFVEKHHRHSARTAADGGKFAVGLQTDEGELVGVGIVGRPVARLLADDTTAELLRCCVSPAAPKGATSKIYARCRRIWQLMGGTKFVTYTLKREGGASMRGAGLVEPFAEVAQQQWTRKSRPRDERAIYEEPKVAMAGRLADCASENVKALRGRHDRSRCANDLEHRDRSSDLSDAWSDWARLEIRPTIRSL